MICGNVKNGRAPLSAFVPFAPFTVRSLNNSMTLKWSFLFTALQAISILSFYLNFAVNDFLWCFYSVFAYLMVATPLYFNGAKIGVGEVHPQNLTFGNLFRTCANAAFSDYRISLLSRIPLVLQVLTGGSVLYAIFGADWAMHALGGFGVGALAWKAYVAGVGQFSYGRLASYFHLDRYHTFKTERKNASAEFTLFSIIVVAVLWEVAERIIYFIAPANVFRIWAEPLWNIIGDIIFGAVGAMIAWYILTHKTNGNRNPLQPPVPTWQSTTQRQQQCIRFLAAEQQESQMTALTGTEQPKLQEKEKISG